MIPEYVNDWMKEASRLKMRGLSAQAFDEPDKQFEATCCFFDAARLHSDIIDGDWFVELGIDGCAYHAVESCALYIMARNPPDAMTLARGLKKMPAHIKGKLDVIRDAEALHKRFDKQRAEVEREYMKTLSMTAVSLARLDKMAQEFPGAYTVWWGLFRRTKGERPDADVTDYLRRAVRLNPRDPALAALLMNEEMRDPPVTNELERMRTIALPFAQEGAVETDVMLALAHMRAWQRGEEAVSALEEGIRLAHRAHRGTSELVGVVENAGFLAQYLAALKRGESTVQLLEQVARQSGRDPPKSPEDLFRVTPPTGFSFALPREGAPAALNA